MVVSAACRVPVMQKWDRAGLGEGQEFQAGAHYEWRC